MTAFNRVFDNPDLLSLIYGFGDPDHRLRLKKVHEEMDGTTLSVVSKKDLTLFQEAFVAEFHDDLQDFYKLANCHCCSRHTHRKPWISIHKTKILFYYGERGHAQTPMELCKKKVLVYRDYGERVPEDKCLGDCDCRCRQIARSIHYHIESTLWWR